MKTSWRDIAVRAALVGGAAATSHVAGSLPPEWLALVLALLGVAPPAK